MGYAIPSLNTAAWRKSSHSDSHGGHCVETAPLPAHVGIRDSKNPHGPALVVAAEQWRPFLARTKGTLSQGV